MKLGYLYIGDRTTREESQRKAVIADGALPKRIHVDHAPDRAERAQLADRGTRVGDVIVIASPALLGSGARDLAQILSTLAGKGVLVQICGGEPVLYDDAGKIEHFQTLARDASRQANGKNLGKRSGPAGRPAYWEPKPEHEPLIKHIWHDKNSSIEEVLKEASDKAKKPIRRPHLQYRYGNRSKS